MPRRQQSRYADEARAGDVREQDNRMEGIDATAGRAGNETQKNWQVAHLFFIIFTILACCASGELIRPWEMLFTSNRYHAENQSQLSAVSCKCPVSAPKTILASTPNSMIHRSAGGSELEQEVNIAKCRLHPVGGRIKGRISMEKC